MKELKTYAHLYIGQIMRYVGNGKPFRGTKIDEPLTVENYNLMLFSNDRKLVLRPLSELTEDEAIEIAEIMYGQPDSIKWRMEDKGDYFNVYRKHYGRSFTIDKASGDIDRYEKTDFVNEAGDLSEASELEITLNHHIITAYMLSRGFDLFGLIDSGLAVSKTETKNP